MESDEDEIKEFQANSSQSVLQWICDYAATYDLTKLIEGVQEISVRTADLLENSKEVHF